MTVRDYIQIVRIKNAIDMLSSTNYSIAEIAEECGFHSANYFSKVFSAKVGITPTEYRDKKYTRQPEIPSSGIAKTFME